MRDNVNPILRTILIDEPSGEDEFHGKGHQRTAEALARAITGFRGNDRAIGLDGPWGSGKSTVVEIARRKLEAEGAKDGVSYHFFNFDIWQSQGSSFRRSFLEHFLDWSRANFPKKDAQIENIEHKVKGKVRQVQSNNKSMLDWWGISVVLFIPFAPLYYFWAKSAFDTAQKDDTSFVLSAPFIFLTLFIAAALFKALWRCFEDWDGARKSRVRHFLARYREALSQTLLISAKQYENQKVTQYIRETDPNDFEFQSTLREILSVVQAETSRVILVLDNIDRLPKKEIDEYWAQVRAVFSNGPLNERSGGANSVTAIVPYHRHLIEEGHEEKAGAQDASITSLARREIFAKTFDEILTISPPVMSNSREFFLKKIRRALPNITDSDELFRVYLIFNRMLQKDSGNATPRQIIAFINELAGMYVLHNARFSLPTVALFIAHQDSLEANPGILNQPNSIDSRMRNLAADAELERNLAAMIFNVDPDLAIQLLIDNKIKQAASGKVTDLLEIAKAPSFDLRVNEVLENNIREWQNSGEFGTVVENFAELATQYSGDAKSHFSKTLVQAIDGVSKINLNAAEYLKLFRAYDLALPTQLLGMTQKLLHAGLVSLGGVPLDADHGVKWAAYVGDINRQLNKMGEASVLERALSVTSMPSSPDFLFGVAASARNEQLTLKVFNPPKFKPAPEVGELEAMAIERPDAALLAFSEFKQLSLVDDDDWVSICKSLRQRLEADNVDDTEDYRFQLILLAEIVTYVKSGNRGEIDAKGLFGSARFYENLSASVSAEDDLAVASAVFLALLVFGSASPPLPTRLAPNGTKAQITSEQYEWFQSILSVQTALTGGQLEHIGSLGKRALVIGEWTGAGNSVAEDHVLRAVLRSAFTTGDLPYTGLPLLLSHFDYLRDVWADETLAVLERYQVRIKDKEVKDLKLADCPVALVRASFEVNGAQWQAFQNRVGELLNSVPTVDWSSHLVAGDHYAKLLLAKIATSGFVFEDVAFREIYIDFLLSVLAGRAVLTDATVNYDLLLNTFDKNFHSDIFRKLREDLKDVSAITIEIAMKAFPATISNIVSSGDRLSKGEKDNLVRFVLCPALEGGNQPLLQRFVGLGHTKVRGIIKQSEESTQKKLEGAWVVFSRGPVDWQLRKHVGELIHGRKKAKTIFDILLGTGRDAEEEEEDAKDNA